MFEQIKPVYFERPTGRGESTTEMNRFGPNEFWATIGLRVEPTPFGSGVTFEREVEWGALPRAFHRAIEETALRTLEHGPNGWEITDCAVTLIRHGYEAPLSVAADFRNLTPIVLMRALENAGTQVYEPCLSAELEVPNDTVTRRHRTPQRARRHHHQLLSKGRPG